MKNFRLRRCPATAGKTAAYTMVSGNGRRNCRLHEGVRQRQKKLPLIPRCPATAEKTAAYKKVSGNGRRNCSLYEGVRQRQEKLPLIRRCPAMAEKTVTYEAVRQILNFYALTKQRKIERGKMSLGVKGIFNLYYILEYPNHNQEMNGIRL